MNVYIYVKTNAISPRSIHKTYLEINKGCV